MIHCVRTKVARVSSGAVVCNLNGACPQDGIQCSYISEFTRKESTKERIQKELRTAESDCHHIITCVSPSFHCEFFSLQ